MTEPVAELALLAFMAATLLAGIVMGPAAVLPRALAVALFALPAAAAFTIPGPIPALDKYAVVSLPALVLLLAGGKELMRLRPTSCDLLALAFLGILALATLRTQGLYPAGSRVAGVLVSMLLPYLIGRIWVRSPARFEELLRLFVLLALLQTPFMVVEFLAGPFVARLVYGLGIDYAQAVRFGFSRPFMLLRHPLELGNIMALALGAALALRRWRILEGRRRSLWEGPQIAALDRKSVV